MSKKKPKRTKTGIIIFPDHKDFKPNLTPKEIFELGSFGGTYWRPIYSSITKRKYSGKHKEFNFLLKIPESLLTNSECDIEKNKYKVKVGTSLKFWESKGWITKHDPYGWVQWYCRFYKGRRLPEEDERQIGRWKRIAGNKGRFKLWYMNLKRKKKDSPKMRQTLQHWGVRI